MAGNDRKKQRREQKRREKKVLERRAEQGGSPYRRIGAAGQVAACYITRNWRELGLATISVLCRVPGGGHALAVFLVDVWCLGLKDAFGHLDFPAEAFDHHLERAADSGAAMVAVDIGAARRLVAGGIRWAHEHGFRLPPRYERWVALLGDIGDWHTADTRDFGVEGKLRFVGDMEDLRRRLIGQTLEQFIARDDVEVAAAAISPEMLDEEFEDEELEDMEEDLVDQAAGHMFEEAAEDLQGRFLNAVRQWCFANNLVPHPRLPEAVQIVITSMLEAMATPDEDDDAPAAAAGLNLDRMLSFETAESKVQLDEALGQVTGLMRSVGGPAGLAAALGLKPPGEEEDEEAAGPQ